MQNANIGRMLSGADTCPDYPDDCLSPKPDGRLAITAAIPFPARTRLSARNVFLHEDTQRIGSVIAKRFTSLITG